ncbi:YacC family pilotin-like protein [Rosenbergiella australiborealis]|uniref:YacC family pilotin-like protein n=1 Tax=Rosenbergiella australiborealis TaxID=1544696 RepID=A0ABS5T1L4_9GAMM|nr:YacC family pilotin-like protein [Rosenbergiella australiborealis]MBT0726218.1 YacC family pilotin-like protein [Rosenbergiella australiborealis]
MKILAKILFFPLFFLLSSYCYALDDSQADDMADLTAVFIYLKNDCGYHDLPDPQIRNALIYFAQHNGWNLSNYNSFNMQQRGESSYEDLRGIHIKNEDKCRLLAEKTLGLLAYG